MLSLLAAVLLLSLLLDDESPLLPPPSPLLAPLWLLIALIPVSALFSALCLALAAFARSSKEGQYYLMPLVMITMPLVILPMAPGVELTLGNSLIPVTGIVLLLRAMLEGNYAQALPFVPPVVLVTLPFRRTPKAPPPVLTPVPVMVMAPPALIAPPTLTPHAARFPWRTGRTHRAGRCLFARPGRSGGSRCRPAADA